MKTLQNNFTTPEQSKRLLELGVPKWTADCYYEVFPEGIRVKPSPFFVPSDPCWSVGRLIEIMLNSQINTGTKDTFSLESLIDIIDEDIREFDFSKLEE